MKKFEKPRRGEEISKVRDDRLSEVSTYWVGIFDRGTFVSSSRGDFQRTGVGCKYFFWRGVYFFLFLRNFNFSRESLWERTICVHFSIFPFERGISFCLIENLGDTYLGKFRFLLGAFCGREFFFEGQDFIECSIFYRVQSVIASIGGNR